MSVTSFAQRRLWFLEQLEPGSPDYLLPLALRLRGALDVTALSASLLAIVDRHDVLRTRFLTVGGEPVAEVTAPGSAALEVTEAADVAEAFERELARPVDLAVSPLRMTLVRLADGDHLLLVVVHHIAVDGWSWDVLLRELAAGYRGEPVAPPTRQYADFARLQQERLAGPRMDRLLGYWRDRLAGLAPLALPTDRPRPAFWDGSGGVVRFALPTEVVAAVDQLARVNRATRYMVLLGVYQSLLSRYTGHTDIAVCTTVADRGHADTAQLIGPFFNTVVLRGDLSGNPGFGELLTRVRTSALRDLSHAEAPFDRVVGEVTASRDLSRHPLCQASFTLLNTAQERLSLPGVDVDLVPPPLSGTPMDVFLDLNLCPDGSIAARLQYATALFERDTMTRFSRGYLDLLRAVLADRDTPVAELAQRLDPLPGKENLRLLTEWSGASDRPDEVPTAVAVHGEADHPALECAGRSVSYAELDGLAGGLAAELVGAGVGRGDAVGVCTGRGVWSVIAMLAVWRAGGVFVPLDRSFPVDRLRCMIAEAGVGRVICDDGSAELTGRLGVPVLPVERVEPVIGGPARTPDPADLAYVIFTSGSSGRPKAVGVEHAAIAAHVAAARQRFGITGTDRVLAFASFTFDASFDQLLPALNCGGTVVIRPDEQWLPARLPEVLRANRITVANFPPTYWAELAHTLTGRAATSLAGLRLLILGGEAIPAAALAAWQAAVPHVRVVNAYGPTETVVTATTHDLVPAEGPVPIGRPLGGRRVYVLDSEHRPAPVGTPGELLIGGTELARGYLGRPGQTAQRFVPDPFGGDGGRLYRTGDLVRWLRDGTLEFLGRVDDQVKIRGFRIEPGEVEAVLAGCPGVTAAAVAARADTHGIQSLVGYVVAAGEVGVNALREWCARTLPPYAVPSEFVLLDTLPATVSGKLDRAALPAPGEHRAAADTGHVSPREDTERVIAEIWGAVLGVGAIGIDDSFFDLGGHSLLATMAVSRIAERLGREVELRTLFENPRIREFAPAVTAARAAASTAIVPVERDGEPLPMSFAQERLWFLDRMSDSTDGHRGDDYVLWYCWRVGGTLDRAAWQGALDDVVARHEVLRTALVEVAGRPVQRVLDGVGVPLQWQHAADAELARERAWEFATRRFDLARPPMVRSAVWQLGSADQVVVIAFHHVATDGWSKDIVVDELARAYTARLAGRQAALPPLPVQYADYAVWQRGQASGGALHRQLDYWRGALDGVGVLELPTDRPRPPVRTGRGGAVEVPLPAELATGLDDLARRTGSTRYMVLLAAFQVVLARWSGQHDIPVGTPVAGRGRTELERLVGFFVNTVVLRGDLSGEPSFTRLLGRVRESVLGAFDHQDVPFERLVEELRPERDLSRNPLFQVMFDVQETMPGGPDVPGLTFSTFALPWTSAKFDLSATFLLDPDRFSLDVEYSADVFDATTAVRLAEHVGMVLAAAVADPDVGVWQLDLRTPRERALTAPRAAGTPDRPPLFTPASAGDDIALVCGEHRVRYAELDEMTGGLAAELVAAGVTRGASVGVCLARGIWSVVAMLAIWRAGGVYVPLDPTFPVDRLRHMIAEAGVGRVIGDDRTADRTARLDVPVLPVARVTQAPAGPWVDRRPDDLAYVIFTSGSSGRPKAVGVEHGPLAAHLAAARDLFELTATDRVLSFASLSFDASLEQILPALSVGARVVLRPDEVWTPEELAAEVARERVTVMELTPAYWEELVARLDGLGDALASLRLFVTGGEAMPSAPLRRWFDALPGVPIVNTYGPTESVVSATAYVVREPETGRVPIGRPLAGRRVCVVDGRGHPVPVGVPGELLVGGSELARGYLNRPAETAERFVPDPFAAGGRLYRTGDLVRWLDDGGLEFLGRVDDQIKIRGFRVEPGEVQAVLTALTGVRAATVVAREVNGERCLVGYLAGSGLDVEHVREWCGQQLPAFLVPSAFVLLDTLPLTVQGKVDVAALPDPAPRPTARFVPPRTPTEQVTAQVWAEVLGVARVGLHDNFFVLGGHSMRAVAVATRLRAAFDCPIGVRDIFENPTVDRLAAEVERQIVEQISAMSDDEIELSLSLDI